MGEKFSFIKILNIIKTSLMSIVTFLAYILWVFCLWRKPAWKKIELEIKTARDRVMKIKKKFIKTRFLLNNNSWAELDELVVQVGTLRNDINTLIQYSGFIQKIKLLGAKYKFVWYTQQFEDAIYERDKNAALETFRNSMNSLNILLRSVL